MKKYIVTISLFTLLVVFVNAQTTDEIAWEHVGIAKK